MKRQIMLPDFDFTFLLIPSQLSQCLLPRKRNTSKCPTLTADTAELVESTPGSKVKKKNRERSKKKKVLFHTLRRGIVPPCCIRDVDVLLQNFLRHAVLCILRDSKNSIKPQRIPGPQYSWLLPLFYLSDILFL